MTQSASEQTKAVADIIELRKAFGRADMKTVWLSLPTLFDEITRLRAERPGWREGIEAAMKLMDQIGCDWRDAGDMTKFYATNYLVEAIRALHPSVAEGRGDDNSADAAASPFDHNQ